MEPSEYLAAITTESEALADAAAVTSFDAPVLSCPGWTMIDLVIHAGLVQRWATEIVATNAQERPPIGDAPKPASSDELADWFREGSVALVAALQAADPRRAGVELRLRAQAHVLVPAPGAGSRRCTGGMPRSPRGRPRRSTAALAADGIDEWLGMLAVRGTGGCVGG